MPDYVKDRAESEAKIEAVIESFFSVKGMVAYNRQNGRCLGEFFKAAFRFLFLFSHANPFRYKLYTLCGLFFLIPALRAVFSCNSIIYNDLPAVLLVSNAPFEASFASFEASFASFEASLASFQASLASFEASNGAFKPPSTTDHPSPFFN